MSDSTVSGAPGAQSHVPGQDASGESAAGVAPGAGSLDAGMDPDAPSEDSLDAAGDSLGDDAALPGDPSSASGRRGDSITGETDAATGS